jgi:hypothetical protein
MFFSSEPYYSMFVELEYVYLSQFKIWSLGFLDTLLTWTEGLSGTEKQIYLNDIRRLQYHFRSAVDRLAISSKDDWVNKCIPKIKSEALKRYHEIVYALFQTIMNEEKKRGLRPGQLSGDPLEQEDIMGRCRGHISIEAMALCKELLRPEMSDYLPFWEPLITMHLNTTAEELAKLRDYTIELSESPAGPAGPASPDKSKIAVPLPDISLTDGLEHLADPQAEPQANVKREAGVRRVPSFDCQEPSSEIESLQAVVQGMGTVTPDANDDLGDCDESFDSF